MSSSENPFLWQRVQAYSLILFYQKKGIWFYVEVFNQLEWNFDQGNKNVVSIVKNGFFSAVCIFAFCQK